MEKLFIKFATNPLVFFNYPTGHNNVKIIIVLKGIKYFDQSLHSFFAFEDKFSFLFFQSTLYVDLVPKLKQFENIFVVRNYLKCVVTNKVREK